MKRPIPWDSLDYIAQNGTPTHTHVLMTLLRCTSPITGKIKVTLDELADAANLSRKTIQRSTSWLEEHGLVASKRLGQYAGKMYTVHHRVVTDDQYTATPVTSHMASDQGFSDLLASVVPLEYGSSTHIHENDRGTTSLYHAPSVYNVHNSDGTFGDMILGADIDRSPSPEVPPKKSKAVSPTLDVLDYWNFIARRVGAVPVSKQQDRIIFLTQVKRILAGGVTPFGIKSMIADFFQRDSHREHRAPHMVFFSKDVQRTFMSGRDIHVDDDVLSWVASGFVESTSVPWSDDFCREFQNMVLRRGLSVVYRYPDLVASIARVASGDIALAKRLVSDAATLLDEGLAGRCIESDRICANFTSLGVILPTDLASGSPSRTEASSLQEAVLVARTYA